MPYKDKEKQREAQRLWARKKYPHLTEKQRQGRRDANKRWRIGKALEELRFIREVRQEREEAKRKGYWGNLAAQSRGLF